MKALIIGFGHAGKAYTAALEATFNDIQIHIEDNNPRTEIPDKYVFFEKNKQLFYDIAIVATPPSTHLVVMKKVYTRSKLVIIEKPIAIDRSDHNEILQFANENPGVYFSFHAAFGKELSILPISNLCQNSTIINMAHLFCDPYSKLEKQHLDFREHPCRTWGRPRQNLKHKQIFQNIRQFFDHRCRVQHGQSCWKLRWSHLQQHLHQP